MADNRASRNNNPTLSPPNLKECQDILLNAPIGIYASIPEGRFIEANPALARLYGYDSLHELIDAISDINAQIYVDPTDRKHFVRQLKDHGKLISHQCRQRRKDGSFFWASEYARAVCDDAGKLTHYQGFIIDISDQKRVEEALEKRLLALLQPHDTMGDIAIEDLFAITDLQRLQDQFAQATGVASIITHTDGRPVTKPSNFCRLCSDIIRTTDVGRANCFHSDAMIGRACVEGPTVQKCLSGGLWEAGAGITVGGRHIANWLIGQVRDETQPEEQIRAYARGIGASEEAVIEAYRDVPTMPREQFERIAQMLFTLANQMSSTAYQNVQQARFISERKKVELAIREREGLLKSVLRSAPVGIGVVINRVIKQANQRLCEISGYSAEELIGQSARIFYPDDEEFTTVGARKYALIGDHGTGSVETRWRHKDGTMIDILLSSTPIVASDLSKGVTFSALDITERKDNERALRLSENKLAGYARQMEQFSISASSMLSIKDENIVFARISQAIVDYSDFRRVLISLFKDEAPYRDIIGYGGISEEVVARLADIPMPKSWYDHVFVQGLRLGQSSYYIPHTMKHILNQDATVYGEEHAPVSESAWHPEDNLFVRLSDEQGTFIGVISVDESKSGLRPSLETVRPLEVYAGMIGQIIVLKREQANRERLEEQLRMAQKMESVGRLAGGVAHDFNNMLGVILGYSELALAQIGTEQPISGALQGIHQAARRSADLTQQLLAFARKQEVVPRVLDLNEVLAGMLDMLKRLIGEHIDLVWQPGDHLAPVNMDPSQIDQILANLCINARDAMKDTGRIVIETGNAAVDDADTSRYAEAVPGHYVLLSVSDDGCGIDPETRSHLFEPFFTTKDIGKGTGLGLATVYGIVKQNNGFVIVDSESGRGTTFSIYLPSHDEHINTPSPPASKKTSVSGTETILLVEDEPMILEMTTIMLRDHGYHVLGASLPAEAIHLARTHSGQIHLLLTDVIMPDMNGRDLANQILACHSGLDCLFMSGYTADVIADHGVLDEGVHFIQKPFTMQDLAVKVRAIFDVHPQ
ncbi:MAG: PocR ligand-binding domain-containing protein [Desulfobulbaceae bacterium]|nr:PocR ligand-binding domain-containing protein [Desulfobulbaceae bacterium]